MARTKAPNTGKSTKTAPQKRTVAAKSPAKKQRSKATPEIDQRYRSLFDTSLDAILVADDEQNYIDANPAACELLGYKKNELLKKNIKDVVHMPVEVKDQLWGEFIQKQTQANIGGWEMDPITNTLYWSEFTKKIYEVNADYEPTVEAAIHFYKEGESPSRSISVNFGRAWKRFSLRRTHNEIWKCCRYNHAISHHAVEFNGKK